MLQLETY